MNNQGWLGCGDSHAYGYRESMGFPQVFRGYDTGVGL